ncbi:MAG: glycosyltransferase family 2 protein [Chloroflexota bacterium]
MTVYPSVYTIILNWNNAQDTLGTIRSVLELDYPNNSILVVDNGSTDGSREIIAERYPHVELLALDKNLGYAEGNNVGIRHALKAEPKYLFVLNNDTFVDPPMLTKLVEVLESDGQIGMAGPKMYCTDPEDALFAAGSTILWSCGDLWHHGMFVPESDFEANIVDNKPVDFIVGCGLLVRSSLIEQIGTLDAAYYLNYEDVEWGERTRRHGFSVMYVPEAIMWHKVSATLGQASAANTYYMTRNSLRFFARNGPVHMRWLPLLRILFRTTRTVGAWSLKAEYRNLQFRRKRDANLLAMRDFLLGRFGEMGSDVAQVCYGKPT